MSDIVNKNENLELELEDNTILSNLFGINDRNLSLIEQINQVKIQYRGNKIKISGNKKSICFGATSVKTETSFIHPSDIFHDKSVILDLNKFIK